MSQMKLRGQIYLNGIVEYREYQAQDEFTTQVFRELLKNYSATDLIEQLARQEYIDHTLPGRVKLYNSRLGSTNSIEITLSGDRIALVSRKVFKTWKDTDWNDIDCSDIPKGVPLAVRYKENEHDAGWCYVVVFYHGNGKFDFAGSVGNQYYLDVYNKVQLKAI